jgi:hypothetical protein
MTFIRGLALACLLPPLSAEQVTVAVTPGVEFGVFNVAASSAGSPPVTVSYSGASLNAGRRLRISVRPASPAFSTPAGSSISADKVSWTAGGASGGSASAGALSAGGWTEVFLSGANPSSGSVTLNFNLAAPGAGVKAASQSLGLQWLFESVP